MKPEWSPPVYADRVVAWTGVYPEARDVPVRIHAASCRGLPVWFRIIEPWTRALEPGPLEGGIWVRAGQAVNTIWFAGVLVGASWLAIRNARLGRGDRRTALRFALYLGGLRLLWFLGAHHVTANAELDMFTWHLAGGLYRFGLVYVFYLALEPYARRLWPRMLVSWVRVFDGRLRDPLVGRDLLVGVLYGLSATAVFTALGLIPGMSALEQYGPTTEFWSFESLRGFRQALTAVLGVHTQSLFIMFFGILMFLVLRILLRRTWIAIGLFSLLALPLFYPGRGNPLLYVIAFVLLLPLFWIVLFRFGLLSIIAGATVGDLLRQMPIAHDLASWRGAPTVLTLAILVALAAWGFWTSLAGRPLFRDELQASEPGP
jgi:hypothetical protein